MCNGSLSENADVQEDKMSYIETSEMAAPLVRQLTAH